MRGVLLINLGTPDTPTAPAVRSYLKRFLGDRRVIQTPKILWQPLLRLIILPIRSPHSAAMYQQIWTAAGSPLLTITQEQTAKLQALMPEARVRYAMSYSEPFIDQELTAMAAAGVDDLTVIPMYPQYSTTTIASVHDSIHRYYLKQVDSPTLHVVGAFYQQPAYLDALAANIKRQLAGKVYDHVIFSYHGIPQSYADQGDPYPQQCQATTDALVARLQLPVDHTITFQSKFGPAKWLTPATIDTLPALAKAGKRRVAVVTPSFVADCLETIYEIDEENGAAFKAAGGEELIRLTPLNADDAFIACLHQLAQ